MSSTSFPSSSFSVTYVENWDFSNCYACWETKRMLIKMMALIISWKLWGAFLRASWIWDPNWAYAQSRWEVQWYREEVMCVAVLSLLFQVRNIWMRYVLMLISGFSEGSSSSCSYSSKYTGLLPFLPCLPIDVSWDTPKYLCPLIILISVIFIIKMPLLKITQYIWSYSFSSSTPFFCLTVKISMF